MTFTIKFSLLNCFMWAMYGFRLTLGQNPPSPCPSVFHYERDENNWYGVVEATGRPYGNEVKMAIVMKYDGSPKDNDIGKVVRVSPDEEIRDVFTNGGIVRYRVVLNVRPLPRLYQIEYNGRIICQSQEKNQFDVVTATREHTVSLKELTPQSSVSSWSQQNGQTHPTRKVVHQTTAKQWKQGENPSSPCPSIFHYERNEDNWYGVVETTSPSYGNDVKMTIVFKYDGRPKDNDIGKVVRVSTDEEIRGVFTNGGTIRYRMVLNVRPLPRLYQIEYNGQVICKSQNKEKEFDVVTATREHTVGLMEFAPQKSVSTWNQKTNPTTGVFNEPISKQTHRPSTTQSQISTQRQNPSSPCPAVFHYERDENNWYGVVEAKGRPYGNDVKITIVMKYDGSPKDNDIGKVMRVSSDEEIRGVFANGGTIRYRVVLNVRPLPTLYQIEYNGHIICQSHGEKNQFNVVTATREFTVSLTELAPQSSVSTWNYQKTNPTTGVFRESTSQQTHPKQVYHPSTTQSQITTVSGCGTPSTSWNIFGMTDDGCEWPWLVALYHVEPSGFRFQCGGSLIGNQFIITAAHCLLNPSKQQIPKERVVAKLGICNLLNSFENDANARTVSSVILHDQYDTKVNDIAILKLELTVTFTKFIQPICLWEGSSDQNVIIGSTSKAVGWSESTMGSLVQGHQLLDVPLWPLDTCRNLHYLTSENTLCAGNIDGSGPCRRDAGTSLYMKQNERWTLRGIIFTDVVVVGGFDKCNPSQFVIYTDVAKYGGWIRNNMK